MKNNTGKKYTLYKNDGKPDNEKPCAFFLTKEGCKNGSNCKFLHSTNDSNTAKNQLVSQSQVSNSVSNRNDSRESSSSDSDSDSDSSMDSRKSNERTNGNNRNINNQSIYNENVVNHSNHEFVKLQNSNFSSNRTELVHNSQVRNGNLDVQMKQVNTNSNMNLNEKNNYRNNSKEVADKVQKNHSVSSNSYSSDQFLRNLQYQDNSNIEDDRNQKRSKHSVNGPHQDEDTQFLYSAVNYALEGSKQDNTTPFSPNNGNHAYRNQVIRSSSTSEKKKSKKDKKEKETNYSNSTTLTDFNQSQLNDVKTYPTQSYIQSQNINNNISAQSNQYSNSSPSTGFMNNTNIQSTTSNSSKPIGIVEDKYSWGQLVDISKNYVRYSKNYGFTDDITWVKSKPPGDWCKGKKIYEILALDCEMCETTDPVTGVKDLNALVRVSVINGLNPDEIIIDLLVNPGLPITEMRTNIHGISEKEVIESKITLRHVQAMILNFCCTETIFVGHALYNDFKTLHFSHSNVIDTSYLFQLDVTNNSNFPPSASLRELADQLLGYKLKPIHDSIDDAKASLLCAKHFMKHGGSIIQRVNTSNNTQFHNNLLVHRIPESFNEDMIFQIFVKSTHVLPVKVNQINFNSANNSNSNNANALKTGKSVVTFSSKEHADLAFNSIMGNAEVDKLKNKLQKRYYLQNGSYICIRKND